jgi:hypothetical protein
MKFESYPHDTQNCSMKIESREFILIKILPFFKPYHSSEKFLFLPKRNSILTGVLRQK